MVACATCKMQFLSFYRVDDLGSLIQRYVPVGNGRHTKHLALISRQELAFKPECREFARAHAQDNPRNTAGLCQVLFKFECWLVGQTIYWSVIVVIMKGAL
jgi:hypothetical protein